jgi:hypothetical protein
MEGVLRGIELAKNKHGPIRELMEEYRQEFSKQFAAYISPEGRIDWMGILKMING